MRGKICSFFVMMFTTSHVSNSLSSRGLELTDSRRAHSSRGLRRRRLRLRLLRVIRPRARVREVDVRRRLWEFTLRFDESRLQVDDVVS